MTDREVLTKAIGKAQANGYWPGEEGRPYKSGDHWMFEFYPSPDAPGVFMNYEAVIFSHDFAKAFWGEKKELSVSWSGYCKDDECNTNYEVDEAFRIADWEYHLQNMVIEEDPLDYLMRQLEA
ncbi:MAG: hypothetical protein QOJ59_3400 [Thermomicrobiales bacterium]|jgi:hypothetical protein|nr:hypothetical protein [Thermomicrobiales bacterium]